MPANRAKSTALKPEKRPKSAKPTRENVSTAKRVKRPFPLNSLEEALAVPLAIKDKNKGKPYETELVAKFCGSTRKSTPFFYLAAAARDYGLTSGSRQYAIDLH